MYLDINLLLINNDKSKFKFMCFGLRILNSFTYNIIILHNFDCNDMMILYLIIDKINETKYLDIITDEKLNLKSHTTIINLKNFRTYLKSYKIKVYTSKNHSSLYY